MGLYVSQEDIELTVKGKIRFTESDNPDSERMPVRLLNKLMDEAESEVELDLSPRYEVPFKSTTDGAFRTLPRTSLALIRLMCRLKTVLLILDTDFGSGSALNGEEFAKGFQKRYEALKKQAIEKRAQGWGYAFPPLPGLKLAAHNQMADDGFAGMVMTTNPSGGDTEYAAGQINDPSEAFWARRCEDDL